MGITSPAEAPIVKLIPCKLPTKSGAISRKAKVYPPIQATKKINNSY